MTAVPETAFFGCTEIKEDTDATDPNADEHTPPPPPTLLLMPVELLLLLLFLLQEDEGEDEVLETGDEDGEEGREAEDTDFGDSDEEDVVEQGEHDVEMAIEFEPGSCGSLLMLLPLPPLLLEVIFEEQLELTTTLLEEE